MNEGERAEIMLVEQSCARVPRLGALAHAAIWGSLFMFKHYWTESLEMFLVEDLQNEVTEEEGKIFAFACHSGNLQLVKWIVQLVPDLDLLEIHLLIACRGGRIQVAEWLVEQGLVITRYCFFMAAMRNHRPLVQWMDDCGYLSCLKTWDVELTLEEVVQRQQWKMAHWLMLNFKMDPAFDEWTDQQVQTATVTSDDEDLLAFDLYLMKNIVRRPIRIPGLPSPRTKLADLHLDGFFDLPH